MYNIKLDENSYFTGLYSAVGTVPDGIDIPSLPPIDDYQKSLCYKYVYQTVETVYKKPEIEIDINTIYEDYTETISVLNWYFDDEKYNKELLKNLDVQRQNKLIELNSECNKAIISGIDVQTDMGLEHFSLNNDDQINLQDCYLEILSGVKEVLYHADGNGDNCRLFSPEEIKTIVNMAKKHKTYHMTYFNIIKALVYRSNSIDDIKKIFYGMELPKDLDDSLITKIGQTSIK